MSCSSTSTITHIPWLWEQIISETLLPTRRLLKEIEDNSYHRFMIDLEWQLVQFNRVNQSTRWICRSERFLRHLLESLFPKVTCYPLSDSRSSSGCCAFTRAPWTSDTRHELLRCYKGRYDFVWLTLFKLSRFTISPSKAAADHGDKDGDGMFFAPDPLVSWPLAAPQCVPIAGRIDAVNANNAVSSQKGLILFPSARPRVCDRQNSNDTDDEGYGSERSWQSPPFTEQCIYVSKQSCLLRADWKQPTIISNGPRATVIIMHPSDVEAMEGVEGEEPLSRHKVWYPPRRRFLFEDMLSLADSYGRVLFLRSQRDCEEALEFQRSRCTACFRQFPLCGDYSSADFCGSCLQAMAPLRASL
jgi:hypothetical protein